MAKHIMEIIIVVPYVFIIPVIYVGSKIRVFNLFYKRLDVFNVLYVGVKYSYFNVLYKWFEHTEQL